MVKVDERTDPGSYIDKKADKTKREEKQNLASYYYIFYIIFFNKVWKFHP